MQYSSFLLFWTVRSADNYLAASLQCGINANGSDRAKRHNNGQTDLKDHFSEQDIQGTFLVMSDIFE